MSETNSDSDDDDRAFNERTSFSFGLVKRLRKRIHKMAKAAIKRTPHTNRKMPWTQEIQIVLPENNRAHTPNLLVEILFLGLDEYEISRTTRMITWHLRGSDDIWKFLDTQEGLVHPVKFDGMVRQNPLTGTVPRIHAYAAYSEMKAKYRLGSGVLKLQFRTILARAESDEPQPSPLELMRLLMQHDARRY